MTFACRENSSGGKEKGLIALLVLRILQAFQAAGSKSYHEILNELINELHIDTCMLQSIETFIEHLIIGLSTDDTDAMSLLHSESECKTLDDTTEEVVFPTIIHNLNEQAKKSNSVSKQDDVNKISDAMGYNALVYENNNTRGDYIRTSNGSPDPDIVSRGNEESHLMIGNGNGDGPACGFHGSEDIVDSNHIDGAHLNHNVSGHNAAFDVNDPVHIDSNGNGQLNITPTAPH